MVNNVNGSTSVQNSTTRGREKTQSSTQTPARAPETARADTDKVELSPEATQMKDIESGLKRFPEVNHERVSHIKAALRDGSYEVNPARLAAKIAQFELDI